MDVATVRLRTPSDGQPVARANAHRPSFFEYDSYARNFVLALGERGSSVTFGKMPTPARYKFLSLLTVSLAVPSWLGLASMLFIIWTAMAQWDEKMLRPFELTIIGGTFVCGTISAILAGFLLWRVRKIALFIFSWLPLVIVGSVTIYVQTLR